jgi:hypothetical protein
VVAFNEDAEATSLDEVGQAVRVAADRITRALGGRAQ